MNILLLAPQPFYQNRGTPIAVDMLVRTLCENGHNVHLVVFAQGEERVYQNLKLTRVGTRLGFQDIPPGFSAKKIILDLAMIVKVIQLLRTDQYDLIHAVEESVFIAWLVTRFNSRPFIYDMDSSMVTQLIDRFPKLRLFDRPLRWMEGIPIRRALLVIPVSDALAKIANSYRTGGVHLLQDVSLMNKCTDQNDPDLSVPSLCSLFDTPRRILLYVGNLESYQGIDLMIESHALSIQRHPTIALVIVGGSDTDIAHYRRKVESLGLAHSVRFIGRKPISMLHALCKQADILLSPRIQGENTPMKLYSYLDSGVPVLATNLPTHTEVISEAIGYIAEPNPQDYSAAIDAILDDPYKAKEKAHLAEEFIHQYHSKEAYIRRVRTIYQTAQNAMELEQP